MAKKCEACHKRAPVAKDVEGVRLCSPCLEACDHADGCPCRMCKKIAELTRAVNRLIPALRACVRVSSYAKRWHGSWAVNSGDVAACDDAIKYANIEAVNEANKTWVQV